MANKMVFDARAMAFLRSVAGGHGGRGPLAGCSADTYERDFRA